MAFPLRLTMRLIVLVCDYKSVYTHIAWPHFRFRVVADNATSHCPGAHFDVDYRRTNSHTHREDIMDDASQRQRYHINAMHGHDLGLWVCEGSGLSLSPVLFMQAICPTAEPRPLLVKWKADTEPPKPFRKEGALPLIYSDCGKLPAWPYYVHFFAPQAPVEQALHDTSNLHDWAWTVPIRGIVVTFDQQHDRPPSAFSLDRFRSRKPTPPLVWAQAQQLPLVIAALGYDGDSDASQYFRDRYQLAPAVPVIPCPALANERKPGAQGGMFSGVFDRQNVIFDRDYAGKVLGELLKQIAHAR
jgi:hypothetical protein